MSKLTHPYVDGFVAAVPSANKDAFIEHARAAAVVFKEHGALRIVECWGDDVPEGEVTSFSMAVKRKDDERLILGGFKSIINEEGQGTGRHKSWKRYA